MKVAYSQHFQSTYITIYIHRTNQFYSLKCVHLSCVFTLQDINHDRCGNLILIAINKSETGLSCKMKLPTDMPKQQGTIEKKGKVES